MIVPHKLKGTTDAGGDATVNGTAVSGYVAGIQVNLSALDATADTTITIQSTEDEATSVLTLTNSQADAYYVPSPGAVNTSGSAITDANNLFAVAGIPRVVVAQGGATKAFSVILYFDIER